MKVTIRTEADDGTVEEHQFPMQEGLSINSQPYVLYIWKLNYVFGQLYRHLPVVELPLDGHPPTIGEPA